MARRLSLPREDVSINKIREAHAAEAAPTLDVALVLGITVE
jgi:hypothetical protein